MNCSKNVIIGVLLLATVLLYARTSPYMESSPQPTPIGPLLGSTAPVSGGLGVFTSEHSVDEHGNAAFGVTDGPGVHITWNGVGTHAGSCPLHVLKLTADRMSHLQSTPQSSNDTAKALISVLEAIDALENTNEVSSPVGPGFGFNLNGEEK